MVEVSCKEKIMGSMHLLTNSESKIAKYVLDNFNETLNYNVSELADKAGVSDASVVRFCKSLGYKGFQDFKISAAQDILPRDRYFNPSLEQNDDVMTICKKIFNQSTFYRYAGCFAECNQSCQFAGACGQL